MAANKTKTADTQEFKEKQIINEYPVSDKTKIMMRYVELGDSVYVDLRKFYLDKEGKWMPTAKGIAIPYEIKDKIAIDMNNFEDFTGGISND